MVYSDLFLLKNFQTLKCLSSGNIKSTDDEKSMFLIISDCFLSFSSWSKYTREGLDHFFLVEITQVLITIEFDLILHIKLQEYFARI